MTKAVVSTVILLAVLLGACGPECPPPQQCPACPQVQQQPPPPPPQNTGPTVDEWIDLENFRILFATADANLDAEAQRLLQEVVLAMRARTDVIRVEVRGHTDSQGRDASNEQLSQMRADAVMQYLITLGVPANMLTAVGYGSRHPVTSDSREMDRAQNRRVDFRALIRRPVNR